MSYYVKLSERLGFIFILMNYSLISLFYVMSFVAGIRYCLCHLYKRKKKRRFGRGSLI